MELYGELAYCCKHTGLDEAVAGEYKANLTLAEERLILGQKGQRNLRVLLFSPSTLYIYYHVLEITIDCFFLVFERNLFLVNVDLLLLTAIIHKTFFSFTTTILQMPHTVDYMIGLFLATFSPVDDVKILLKISDLLEAFKSSEVERAKRF